jgi:pyridoxal phosphate enzyme (YggS family)
VIRDRLEERLAEVRHRIADAAERAGREPSSVEILPVTKGHPADAIPLVAEIGLRRIGENRVPEAEQKRAELAGTAGLAWHLIGHLQRNKARRALAVFDVIESVDSTRLAGRLSRLVDEEARDDLEILVQVNASSEAAKTGLALDEAPDALAEICEMPGLKVAGLMTMAPFTSDEVILRETFRRTWQLSERCAEEIERFEPRVLSMGMSNDFEIAVEEGSTRLRLGTVLLGERPK